MGVGRDGDTTTGADTMSDTGADTMSGTGADTMSGTITEQQAGAGAGQGALDPELKPLPVWFFAFEGAMGAAFDFYKAWDGAWMVLAALGAVNIAVGLTVLRRRRKLLKAMLKNSRARKILFGLIGLRVALHVVLGAVGATVESAAGHLALGLVMSALTVGLLWFDQRVSFRALGLTPSGAAA
ncbi:hypothetical protein [Streptomyces luteireticuli]|uniref:hypothetical protein n=1 Tax=Streptomyces luteireticuli TaxID=173858 RepID=UPI0031D867D2